MVTDIPVVCVCVYTHSWSVCLWLHKFLWCVFVFTDIPIVCLCLQTFLECVRLRTFGRYGLQQIQVDAHYLQLYLWRFVSDEK